MSVNKEAAIKTLGVFSFLAIIIVIVFLLLQNLKMEKMLADLNTQIKDASVVSEDESIAHNEEFVLQRQFTSNNNEWGYLVTEGGKTYTFNFLDQRSDFRKYYKDMNPGIRYRCPVRENMEAVFKNDSIVVGECKVVTDDTFVFVRMHDTHKDPKAPKNDM